MLAYEQHGSGRPLYFLHGMSLDRHNLLDVYEPWLQHAPYRRYYLDLPGMGETPGAGFASSDAVLATVQAFIQQTAQGSRPLIVGHSYGGYLALGLLHEALPVAGLFVTCPVVAADAAKRHPARHQTQAAPTGASAAYREYLATNVVINDATWQAYQRQIMPGKAAFDAALWQQIKTSKRYAFSFEAQLPALVQHSDALLQMVLGAQDNVVGTQDQLALRGPRLAATVVPEAGHNVLIDAPAAVHAAFDAWLAQWA